MEKSGNGDNYLRIARALARALARSLGFPSVPITYTFSIIEGTRQHLTP